MITALDLSITRDKISGKYDKLIKNKCAWCGAMIPGTLDYYVLRGNCCSPCNSRYESFISPKYDRETKTMMTLARIKEVRDQGWDKELQPGKYYLYDKTSQNTLEKSSSDSGEVCTVLLEEQRTPCSSSQESSNGNES